MEYITFINAAPPHPDKQMTYTHKLTGQKLLLIKDYNGVSTLYQLDGKGNKIPNGTDVHGEKAYLTAVCNNQNLE